MSAAREAMLNQIRSALRDVPSGERPRDVIITRDYLLTDTSPRASLLDRFVERVTEYKALVKRVSADELPRAIRESCDARSVKRLVIPADLPDDWPPTGVSVLRDPGITNEQIERSDGVLTACTLGIAQTGTLVLDCGPGQGRRVLTLLPDYHLCVIFDHQIVGLVPEAVVKLRDAANSPAHPITFISGPSATSDIELNRVEGVHGPRTLEVIVVETV
jgi:L-lactate dehydrogenase complex protein LldG